MRWYVQSSFSRIDAAKAAFYPSFDIKAFFGVNALHLFDLFTHASQQINLIPGLCLPIFEGGRLNAKLSGARDASNAACFAASRVKPNPPCATGRTGHSLTSTRLERSSGANFKSSVRCYSRASTTPTRAVVDGMSSKAAASDTRHPAKTSSMRNSASGTMAKPSWP